MVLLRRRPRTKRTSRRAAVLVLFEQLQAETPGATVTVEQVAAGLERNGRAMSVKDVGEVVRAMAGRGEGSLPSGNELVEVQPGRFRLRLANDPTFVGPIDLSRDVPLPAVEAGLAVGVAAPPSGCRAAILQVAADLAARTPGGLVRISELAAEVESRFGFSTATVRSLVGRMTGYQDARQRSYSDFERVRRGMYRLRPSAGVLKPLRRSCHTEVVAAVSRLCAESADGTAHIDEIRDAMGASGYSDWTIKSSLRWLVKGELVPRQATFARNEMVRSSSLSRWRFRQAM